MNIETVLSPLELPALTARDLRGTACVVFDVLRATSAFVTALHNSAAAVKVARTSGTPGAQRTAAQPAARSARVPRRAPCGWAVWIGGRATKVAAETADHPCQAPVRRPARSWRGLVDQELTKETTCSAVILWSSSRR